MFGLLAFVMGILVGVVFSAPEVSINEHQLTSANMHCALNNDLDHITVDRQRATAYCTNGATFHLEKK